MKVFSFAKALTLGTLLCLALPVACGDDDDSSGPITPTGGSDAGGDSGNPGPEAGAGGMMSAMLPPGISDKPSSTMCTGSTDKCDSAAVLGGLNIEPCCDTTDTCGLNTGFLALVGAQFKEVCQAHNQAGDVTDACPDAAGLKVPFEMAGMTVMIPLDPFPGCCRPDGTCGVVIDSVTSGGKLKIADFNLGCVDAEPFAGKVNTCQSTGMGGAGGMGGGAGGDAAGPSAGGAGGAP
jgi:hypothetical protein